MKHKVPERIVLLDFWSEKNRGDAAMQIALIELVRKHFPDAKVSVVGAYGYNQWPEFLTELDYTRDLIPDIVGGFRRTFFPLRSIDKSDNRLVKFVRYGINIATELVLLFGLTRPGIRRFLLKYAPQGMRQALERIMSADLIIWNGRNFQCNSRWKEPFVYWNLLYNPLVCMMLQKPVICIGASVWDIKTVLGRELLRFAFRRLVFMSVREPRSFKNVQELLGQDGGQVRLLPDLSFWVLQREAKFDAERVAGRTYMQRVGITLMDWWGEGQEARQKYINAICRLIEFVVQELRGKIIIVPQVTYRPENTDRIFRDIFSGLPSVCQKHVYRIEKELTIKELLKVYGNLDFLIATRMHSAIFALASGTPVVAIAYDSGAKWGILEMLGAGEIIIPFRDVSAEGLVSKVMEVWSNRVALLGVVGKHLSELYLSVEDHIRLARDMYEESATEVPWQR
jgi:polysaccharide pyruvyl transferase WcaK-like protein